MAVNQWQFYKDHFHTALLKADTVWDIVVLTTKNSKKMKIKRSS